LIALIANARLRRRMTEYRIQNTDESVLRSPFSDIRFPPGVGLFRKDQFCFKRIRELQRSSLSPQLRRSQGHDESQRRDPLGDRTLPSPRPLDRMRFLFTMS